MAIVFKRAMNKIEFQQWLSNELGMKVDDNTEFFTDLDLFEEDIEIFFLKFISKFEIDAEGFDYEEYNPRKVGLFDGLLKTKRVKTFKTDHLIQVISNKKWFDPDCL
ncbi:MAG: hypothetical protein CL840_08360 [Crocinitomicaceae bacterium]|nr:hypothetical protein [Crocinitomicaceae bacterium]|tara:strand:- start:1331 stop:1651 length:321 start_codon:yes stop_codon:yes gene_type:complete